MGVALVRVPEDVGAQQQVGLDKGQNPWGAALVQLKDGQVLFGLAKEGGVGDEAGGHPRGHIGAGPVAGKFIPALGEHVLHHVGDSGLPVGAGDANDILGAGHPAQKVRAHDGPAAGHRGALAADELHHLGGRLGEQQCKVKARAPFHKSRLLSLSQILPANGLDPHTVKRIMKIMYPLHTLT